MSDRTWNVLPWVSLFAGLTLLLIYLGARIDGEAGRRSQLARFEQARGAGVTALADSSSSAGNLAAPGSAAGVDQSLWSEDRIAGYRESLGHRFEPPLAVLRIPRLELEVPVLPGTDELTLNRAVGHIPGTALPGQTGNAGVAGHRDGFFRGLKDLELGDRLEVETLDGRQELVVTRLSIVTPADVQVLDPTPSPVLTLVTCYPFYFVGKAPKRYIVRAEAHPVSTAGDGGNGEAEDGPLK